MSAIVILGGIELPDDMVWKDELDWCPVTQIITPTLTGSVVVEETASLSGRPITLTGVTTRGVVRQLKTLEAELSHPMQLAIQGSQLLTAWRPALAAAGDAAAAHLGGGHGLAGHDALDVGLHVFGLDAALGAGGGDLGEIHAQFPGKGTHRGRGVHLAAQGQAVGRGSGGRGEGLGGRGAVQFRRDDRGGGRCRCGSRRGCSRSCLGFFATEKLFTGVFDETEKAHGMVSCMRGDKTRMRAASPRQRW